MWYALAALVVLAAGAVIITFSLAATPAEGWYINRERGVAFWLRDGRLDGPYVQEPDGFFVRDGRYVAGLDFEFSFTPTAPLVRWGEED